MKLSLFAQSLAASAVVSTLVVGAGCSKAHETPSAKRTMEALATPAAVASSPGLTGIWTVVGHHIPGIGAMGDAEATAWHGWTVRLTATETISPTGTHCDEPTYSTHSVAKDRFLGSEFNLPPGSLAPLASLESITVLEVSCGGGRFAAMGGRLVEIDADHALAPWDGVFFELEKDRDFRAAGQEPFWRIEIQKGKEIRFTQVSKAKVVTPAPVPVLDKATGATLYHAITEANDLRVVIESIRCTDVMSGKPFETTVTVTLNGHTFHGCGEALP